MSGNWIYPSSAKPNDVFLWTRQLERRSEIYGRATIANDVALNSTCFLATPRAWTALTSQHG